jgi:hypothetical protein
MTVEVLNRDENDVEQTMSDAEVDAAVAALLEAAGVTMDTLRDQAALGRFASEQHRRAWFVIRGLGRG